MITENHKNAQDCTLLTEQQQKAIDLLLLGKTEKCVAKELEVARETISRWRNHNPNFITALNERQGLIERWHNLLPWAMDVIEQALAKSDPVVAIALVQALAPQQLQAGEIAPQLVLLAQARRATGKKEKNAPAIREETAARLTALNNRRFQSVEALSTRESNREGA